MEEVKVVCLANGNLGYTWHGKKKLYAMCGKIKCRSNECSLPAGECEHQHQEKKVSEDG